MDEIIDAAGLFRCFKAFLLISGVIEILQGCLRRHTVPILGTHTFFTSNYAWRQCRRTPDRSQSSREMYYSIFKVFAAPFNPLTRQTVWPGVTFSTHTINSSLFMSNKSWISMWHVNVESLTVSNAKENIDFLFHQKRISLTWQLSHSHCVHYHVFFLNCLTK